MNKESLKDLNTLDTPKIKQSENLFNLIALGAFLWYFLNVLGSFISHYSLVLGITSEINPKILFWVVQFLDVIVVCVLLRFILIRYWKQVHQNRINLKKQLVIIGLAILLIETSLFLYGSVVMEYLTINYSSAIDSYYLYLQEIDPFFLINTTIDLGKTALLLILFVKWK